MRNKIHLTLAALLSFSPLTATAQVVIPGTFTQVSGYHFLSQPNGTDDTATVQSAIDGTPIGGELISLGGNCYTVGNLTVNRPITIKGTFGKNVCLKAKPGTTGYLITIDKNQVVDNEGFLYNVSLDGLYLDGNLRQPNLGAIKISNLNGGSFTNLICWSFSRECINNYTAVRESVFDNIHTRFCGDKSNNLPCINVSDQSAATSENHNHLRFNRMFVDYSYGDAFLFDTVARKSVGIVRDITISNSMIHGLLPRIDRAGNVAPNPAQRSSRHFNIKYASGIYISNVFSEVTGIGVPFATVEAGKAGHPTDVHFTNWSTAGRYAYTGTQDAIDVTAGDVSIDNSHLDGCATHCISSVAGTKVYLGKNLQMATPPSIGGSTGAINEDNADNFVGIAAWPKARLQVGTDLTFSDAWPSVCFNLYYNRGWKYLVSNYGGCFQYDYENKGINFFGAGRGTAGSAATTSTALFVKYNGNVGVGNITNPTHLLDIGTNASVDATGKGTFNGGLSTGTPGSANKLVCWKDSTHIGYCSTAPDASGNCTCN